MHADASVDLTCTPCGAGRIAYAPACRPVVARRLLNGMARVDRRPCWSSKDILFGLALDGARMQVWWLRLARTRSGDEMAVAISVVADLVGDVLAFIKTSSLR